MRVLGFGVLTTAVILAAAAAAQASPVEYDFSGTANTATAVGIFPIVSDAPFTGSVFLDGSPTNGGAGSYTASGPEYYADVQSGVYDLQFGGTEVVQVVPGNPGSYTISFNDPTAVTLNGASVPLFSADFILTLFAPIVGDGFVLPDVLALTGTPTVQIALIQIVGDVVNAGSYNGAISAFTAAVPVPGGLPLLGTGLAAFGVLGALGWWRKRRFGTPALAA